MKQENMTVISNKEIAHQIYEMILKGNLVSKMRESGQFLHIKVNRDDLILRRPISIASIQDDTVTILYRVVGQGTASLALMKPLDEVDVLGPLGHGFELEAVQANSEVLVVGGGIGVAPLYELGKQLALKQANITFVLGFANAHDAYYLDKFRELGSVRITTDDGSLGTQGHVGAVLDGIEPEFVYACGPLPLLRMYKQATQNVIMSMYPWKSAWRVVWVLAMGVIRKIRTSGSAMTVLYSMRKR